MQKVESATRALGASENEARVAVEQMRLSSEQAATNELRLWQEQMDQRSAEAQARLAQMDHAAKTLKDQIAAASAIGEAGWRGALDADLEEASERWRQKTETMIEEASRLAAEKFGKNAEATGRQLEKLLQERIALIGDSQSQVATDAEETLTMLRAAINQEIARGEGIFTQLQQSAAQLEGKRREFSTQLEAASEDLAQHGQAILEAQSGELNRQAESVVAGMAEQFHSVLQATGSQTVDELVSNLEQRLSPQLARIEDAGNKLMFDREEAEKTLAEHQARVWQASDRNLQDTVTRGKELFARIETEFGESARETITRWINELETKATETTQGTFEALYKSADWYEKKVQNQMQTILQKGADQAAAQLREKAAELSGMFARELDNCSRSYVEHAQGQIQESATRSRRTRQPTNRRSRKRSRFAIHRARRAAWTRTVRSLRLENENGVRTEYRQHGSQRRAGPFQAGKRRPRLCRGVSARPFTARETNPGSGRPGLGSSDRRGQGNPPERISSAPTPVPNGARPRRERCHRRT